MSVFIFLLVLSVLVLVHEFGHFIVARWCGVHVHEFGLGFPPKAAKLFRWKETLFTLNWLPFGGFVKMEGEDTDVAGPHSFNSKHPLKKLAILFAGVVCNFLFAWLLIAVTLGIGVPMSTSVAGSDATNAVTTITAVSSDSPAAQAGIVTGSVVLGIGVANGTLQSVTPEELSAIVAQHQTEELTVRITTPAGAIEEYQITPAYDEQSGMYRIGIATDSIVYERFGFFRAIGTGFTMTARLTSEVTAGLAHLIGGLFTGTADVSSVTGPVGLVGVVGTASKVGLTSLLVLTAVISINLAVINLVPLPALDGGRIIVTIIEWIRGKTFNQKALGIVHTAGFFLLIGVLIAVTVKDVRGLF